MERFPRMLRERWIGPVNFDRANMRVSGMDTYALVGAVLLQVLVGLYGAIPEPGDGAARVERCLFDLQMLLLMVSVLCSTFTMVLFLLSKIYTVTALGLHKDMAYDAFSTATAPYRVRAFWSLIISLVSFICAFSLSLMTRIRGKRGFLASVGALCFGMYALWQWLQVYLLATEHIFLS